MTDVTERKIDTTFLSPTRQWGGVGWEEEGGKRKGE